MIKLLALFDRSVYYLEGTRPAVFFVAEREGGGILVNTPAFSAELLEQVRAVGPLNYLFYPSRLGAMDMGRWRDASGARSMAYGPEAGQLGGPADIVLDREHRFSRTVDFLPMAGRTESACALRCKNKPGIIFFGPILEYGPDGWPTVIEHPDDHSFENRLFGAMGLTELKFEYAFCDDFEPGNSRCGPGAGAAIRERIESMLA